VPVEEQLLQSQDAVLDTLNCVAVISEIGLARMPTDEE
jgi:hypothetical protein